MHQKNATNYLGFKRNIRKIVKNYRNYFQLLSNG